MALDVIDAPIARLTLWSSGLQLLTSVIVADITTLKWRGLVSGLTSAPFISNAFVVTPDQKSLVHVYLGPYSVNTTLADGEWWLPRVVPPITSDAMRAH